MPSRQNDIRSGGEWVTTWPSLTRNSRANPLHRQDKFGKIKNQSELASSETKDID